MYAINTHSYRDTKIV